jgi:cyclopropane fatty-acyl-phospholipid synthase-like methyltransferase
MPSLLLGAGNSRAKKVALKSAPNWTGELVTLDMNPNCGASVVWDLDNHPLPFPDEHFDELAAYDVLEHMGRQGDWRGWFNEMAEYHRLLKPGGKFGIIVPIGTDAFADPGHTRFFSGNYFMMLSQKFYQDQIDANMPVTDYRWFWKKNFNILFMEQIGNHHLAVMLERA